MAQPESMQSQNTTPTKTLKFSAQDARNIIDALDMAAKSYRRAQHQRPQFATIAAQIEEELTELIGRIKSQMPGN